MLSFFAFMSYFHIFYLFIQYLILVLFVDFYSRIGILVLILPWRWDWVSDWFTLSDEWVLQVSQSVITELMIHMTVSDGSVINTSMIRTCLFWWVTSREKQCWCTQACFWVIPQYSQLESVMWCTITNLCWSLSLLCAVCLRAGPDPPQTPPLKVTCFIWLLYHSKRPSGALCGCF